MNKSTPIYLSAGTAAWGLPQKEVERLGSHLICTYNNRKVVFPEKLDQEHVNPKAIADLYTFFGTDEIILIDRLRGTDKKVTIIDHVNRSGTTFLRGKTPLGNRPMFPDVSRIYKPVEKLAQVTVHTLGPNRFNAPPDDEGIIWSETAGQISPLLNYIGYAVYAVGHLIFSEID
jgi:hypothetical protein